MLKQARAQEQRQAPKVGHIQDWLIQEGSRHAPVSDVIQGLCERLNEAGVSLARCFLAARTLHPIYGGFSFHWTSATGAVETNGFVRRPAGQSSPEWDSSPHAYMIERQQLELRIPLDDPDNDLNFPVFEKLIADGGVDYLALLHVFDPEGEANLDNGFATS